MRKKLHRINTAIMYATLLLFPAFLNGCRSHKSASSSTAELFPVYGITLAETDEDTLRKIGKADDGCCVIHGQNFWVHDGTIFEGMYLTSPSQLPLKWRNMGFDWYLTYDQWLDLLNDLGYTITIEEAPHIEMYRGHESFCAEVKAVNITATVPTELSLDFSYSDKTTTSGEGSLYSININIDIPEK